jgi:hypothetical protein
MILGIAGSVRSKLADFPQIGLRGTHNSYCRPVNDFMIFLPMNTAVTAATNKRT